MLCLGNLCVWQANLKVTFELLIVNHDVLSLLALKLGLLQIVLQCPKVLQSNTTLFTKSAKSGIFCHPASIKRAFL